MRVLQLIQSRNFAGSEQSTLVLCRQLRREGHEVFLGAKRGGDFERIARDTGFGAVALDLGGWFPGRRVARFVREHGIQVVHAHLTGAARLAVRAACATGCACVAHARIWRDDRAYHDAARLGLVIANSRHTADFYLRAGLPADRVRVVLNSTAVHETEAARTPRAELRARLLAELDLPPAARLVVLASRLAPDKGQDVLLRAVPAIRARVPDAHFLLPGGQLRRADYGRELDRLTAASGAPGHVHRPGFRADAAAWLRAADVSVLPARDEPFGLVAIESMMLGTPLVAAASGGFLEIVDDPSLGRLVPVGDAAALADAVAGLLEDPAAAAAQAARAEASARARFTPEAMTRRIVAIYEELLDRAPKV